MAIQVRRGLKKDFDPYKMLPGEWAVSIDNQTQNQIVWMCFAAGMVKRMGTYEDFYAQIEEITNDLLEKFLQALYEAAQELQNNVEMYIQGKVDNEWIPELEKLVERAESAAESAKKSEINAKDSEDNTKEYEQSAANSATTATEKAIDAGNSAAAAEEGAKTSAEKAKEASGWADLAESFTHGRTGKREGEEYDNAEEYARQAKESAEQASEIAGGKFVPLSDKGKAGGVATLDDSGKVPAEQLPEIGGAVASVNGKTGKVKLTAEDVNAIPTAEKGVANGVATLDDNAKIPKIQLPEDIGLEEVYIGDEEPTGEPRPDLWVNTSGDDASLNYLDPESKEYKMITIGGGATYTLEVTSTFQVDVGKTVRVTNEKSKWEKQFDDELSVTFELPRNSDTYTIILIGFDEHIEFSKKININETNFVEIKYPKNNIFDIQSILNCHRESIALKIGDEVIITLSNQIEMCYQIGGTNIYEKYDALMVPKWLYPIKYRMHSEGNSGGFNGQELYNWLQNTFLKTLIPNNIQELIVSTTQITYSRTTTGTISFSGKIFIPREWEVLGQAVESSPLENTEGKATQWPIFATAANRIKNLGKDGAPSSYWTCSPRLKWQPQFCTILDNGNADHSGVDTALGVLPCFRLKAQS